MTNNRMIVDERQRDIGNFLVGRLLPFRKKRQVGPFTFIDHMGPSTIGPEEYFDIDQHPHIGLSTLTYLYQGEIEHQDSTGSFQIVKPGDVAFMTSGKGVSHTERTPKHLRSGDPYQMHGFQVWVALPKDLEEMDPRFDYFPAKEIPTWEQDDLRLRVVIGTAFGKQSPLQGFSPQFMVDVEALEDCELNLANQIEGELAVVVVKGEVEDCGETIQQGQMMVSKTNEQCSLELTKGTKLLLFGGEPLPEDRYLLWNFVSSSKERLQQAKSDWEKKLFPKVEGDDTYIPFPTRD